MREGPPFFAASMVIIERSVIFSVGDAAAVLVRRSQFLG